MAQVSFPTTLHPFSCALLQVSPTPSERFALEKEWKLTEATGGQKTGAVALGVANLVGVVILGGLLADAQTRYALARSSLSFVLSSFPALQVCPPLHLRLDSASTALLQPQAQLSGSHLSSSFAVVGMMHLSPCIVSAFVLHSAVSLPAPALLFQPRCSLVGPSRCPMFTAANHPGRHEL